AGTVHFSSSDATATLPPDYTFVPGDAGQHTFNAAITMHSLGSQTLTIVDTLKSWLVWTTSVVIVQTATHFTVTTSPANPTAGNAVIVDVIARDGNNNVATTYNGTVHFSSSDTQAALPADSALTSGSGGFSATFKTAGTQTITATDTVMSSINGSASVTVNAAAANHYSLTVPPTATVNTPFTIRLVAQDIFNNTAKNYTGTAHFATSDAAAGVVLPANYSFQLADNGQKIFTNGVTLQTAGPQSITATDTGNGTINASVPITVTNDAAI